jgi:hypothetical protein
VNYVNDFERIRMFQDAIDNDESQARQWTHTLSFDVFAEARSTARLVGEKLFAPGPGLPEQNQPGRVGRRGREGPTFQ